MGCAEISCRLAQLSAPEAYLQVMPSPALPGHRKSGKGVRELLGTSVTPGLWDPAGPSCIRGSKNKQGAAHCRHLALPRLPRGEVSTTRLTLAHCIGEGLPWEGPSKTKAEKLQGDV